MVENKTGGNKPADDFIRLQDLWGMFVPKWYWFAISLGLTFTVATLYLLVTPPVYTRTASILVKDDSKGGGSTGSGMGDFSDLGIFKNNTNINNELLTLKSPTLMTEVVYRLKLNENYTVKEGLKKKDLYKDSPVSVTGIGPLDIQLEFTIELSSNERFTLSDFVWEKETVDESVEGTVGDSIQTPAGTLILRATPAFSTEILDTPIRYVRKSIKEVTDQYTDALRAELGSEDATIISLSIDDTSIHRAEDVLGTLIQVYNEKWIQDKNQIAISTSQFINDRLGVIEGELGHVDENISSYKSEHLLPDVQAASSLYLSQSAENKKQLLALNSQLSTAKYIRKELNRKLLTQPLPSNSGIDNVNIQSQIGEYNTMVLERNRLLENSSEKNPLVKDLSKSLRSMQTAIVQSVDNLISSLNTQIRDLRTQEASTVSQLASNPNQAKYLLSVERQQKVKEELYLYLLQKREENELSQAFTAYNTRIITAPRGTEWPTAPRKMNILLVAFALGLLVPAVVIFMRENMNTRVRGRKDLENMDIPFVGEIPLEIGKEIKGVKNDYRVVVKEQNRNIINEAFRVVRTNLEFMAGQSNRRRVIMLSSINPGSGKTFISLNLAACFAIKGKRTIVIDMDLRRASLSGYVDKPSKGLSNYLNGQTDNWREIVMRNDENPQLDILPVGTLPPNPTELLFSPRLELLMGELEKEYDYIFIDCPPVEIVADTSIICKWADVTIFIIRAGLMERDMLPIVNGYYTEHKFGNMAMLLNGTTAAYGRYGYHRYGYHYGYGSYGSYGYGNSRK